MQTSTEQFRADVLASLRSDSPAHQLFQCLDSTDSTNSWLKRMAASGIPDGTAVLANRQTGGRGRLGRTFDSPAGMGIYLSMLLRPKCNAIDLMHLTCSAAVAVSKAITETTGLCPKIKWINDLVFNGKKLCGILTELGLLPDGRVDYAIIGVGINCSQKPEDFPEDLRCKATSLELAAGHSISRSHVTAGVLSSLYSMEQVFLCDKPAILEQYRANCITLGKDVSLLRGSKIQHGHAVDIDENGSLIVETAPGVTQTIDSGEVSVRGMYGYID